MAAFTPADREILMAALAARRQEALTIPLLIEFLSHPASAVQIAAAHALQVTPDPRAIPALLNNMAGRRLGVGWAAATAFRALGRPALFALLHRLIEQPASPQLRETAGRVLPHLAHEADPMVVAALEIALHGPAAGVTVPVAADRLLQWYRHKPATVLVRAEEVSAQEHAGPIQG